MPPSLSVIPSLAALRYFLDSEEMIAGMSGVNTMRAELATALKNRFKTLNDNVLFTVAMALDPRYVSSMPRNQQL